MGRRIKAIILIGLILCAGCRELESAPYIDRVVAAVLMAEAGVEGEKGMQAVAEVILVRSRHTGRSPYQTVLIPKWFSCLNNTEARSLVYKFQHTSEFVKAERIATMLRLNPEAITKHTRGSDHYKRKGSYAKWAEGKWPHAVIGNHEFYRLGLSGAYVIK